ncbi:hypothetical protein M2132_001711 [Dysgonomonas sp. PH5-45]|uniref:GyrI-like domain-containing protein n=1 Tax=unclassified Dysgonomonas TaxID=2630389 RepID=UPI0024765641|nr:MULTISPECIES: GyrI-like domain-containing protein [unclassified Dysgonomonas]MDH6355370.1 hypothetical protein [Dysgonomonas sp. PH5-45]MDH6388268.1 hypothetical protein [Dysgonomonas sp. PH5-37]
MMKNILSVIVLLLVLIFSTLLILWVYFGGFSSVRIKESWVGKEIFIYEDLVGDYTQYGIVNDRLFQELSHNHLVETTKGIAVFYEDPQRVPEHELKSRVGRILPKDIKEEVLKQLAGKYKIASLAEGKYLTAEFPYKGRLSQVVGIIRVQSKIWKYCKRHNLKKLPIIEIYDQKAKTIYYRVKMQ